MSRGKRRGVGPFSIAINRLYAFPQIAADDTARLLDGYKRANKAGAYIRRDGRVSIAIVYRKKEPDLKISIRSRWTVGAERFFDAVGHG